MKLFDHRFEINDNYAVSYDISLTYLPTALERHRTEDNLELCPDFQRGHKWNEQEQISFCEFIIKGGKCPPLLFNHPGWLTGKTGNMVCVDGLQRITALEALLDNRLKVFSHYLHEYEDWQAQLGRKHLQIKIHSLQTRYQIISWYLQVNATGRHHTSEDLNKARQLLIASKP